MISSLTDALSERGYDQLTPVQEAVTDPDLAARDLLVSAQTGSGKTVGFGLAIAPTLLGEAERFEPASAPLALVIAPTRELAFQVMRELGWLYAKAGARVASCVGGMDMRDERRALDRGAHIVVGTPGRLRDHITRGSLDMSALRAVVLDEADEMLDLGFREDLEFMLGEAPEDRRTLLFSATVSPAIGKLAEQYQRDAYRVNTLGGTQQHADISYQALRVSASDREHAIFNLLRYQDAESALVFANTRASVNHLTARLSNRGFAVVSLSGELSQNERTHALQAMRDGRARVCVATDVAARGIDLPKLDLVIHAELPTNTESLLHRSGRTGRAGRKGLSALIVPPKEAKKAERLLKWAKITAEWTTPPSADDILRRDEERLLNDPTWQEPATEEQGAFATKLLDLYSAEAIAVAYLRLYRSRQSAPEDLLPPDTKPEKRDHKSFGPSRWFALSVGQNDRAEARWLLPLLCRAGNLDKSAIGAIRVQDSETFVELTEASAAPFLAAIGADKELEDGITVRAVEGTPDIAPPSRSPAPRKSYKDRDDERKPRGAPKYKSDKEGGPRRDAKPEGKYEPKSDARPPRASKPAPAAEAERERPAAPRKPAPAYSGGEDRRDSGKPSYAKSGGKPGGKYEGKSGAKPYGKPGGKPGEKPSGKPGSKYEGKPSGKPGGKPAGKFGDKPSGKFGDKPAGKFGDKPSGKFGGKPAGKPSGKPGGAKHGAPTDARDSSKRFTPPGGAKPGARKPGGKGPGGPGRGGSDAPRRGKS